MAKKEKGLIPTDVGALTGAGMGGSWLLKMVISVLIDIGDFFVGIFGSIFGLPGLSLAGTIYDIGVVPIAYLLWGNVGLINIWEVLAFTDFGNMADAFIPTCTITGILARPGGMVCKSMPMLCKGIGGK